MNEPTKDLGKVCVTVSEEHDSSKEYEILTIVPDTDEKELAIVGSYISIKHVPIGIELNDITYWCPLVKSVTVEELREKLKL